MSLAADLEKLLAELRRDHWFESAVAAEYIGRGIFTPKTAGDALHVAIAVSHGIGYLGSWNFKHLVRVATRREVNLVNALNGYQPLEIVAPPEL